MENEITRNDEIRFLKNQIKNNPIFDNPLSFNDIIENIKSGNLILEISEKYGTKIISNENIKIIKDTLPSLIKIVNKPRSFIKSLEDKIPVETVKRINHKAIAKLSQDSNDWYARTLLSVKPKNIIADVNEETIDLYENRFICTLISRISMLIARSRQYYKEQINKLSTNSTMLEMDKYYNYSTSSFRLYNIVSKNENDYANDSLKDKFEEKLNEIEIIENRIKQLKSSNFYKHIRKKKKIKDPILKTNILMFDQNYNKAYRLWKILNNDVKEEVLNIEDEVDEEESQFNYFLYSFIIVLASLYDMNFFETTNTKIYVDKLNSVIQIPEKLEFSNKIKNKTLELFIENNIIKIVQKNYNGNLYSNKQEEFYFYAKYVNFEKMNRIDVSNYTENLLNELIINKKKEQNVISKYCMLSVNLNRCSENNAYSDKVYKRFYSIGDNFSYDEKIENIKNWAGYKTGIIICTPTELRNNFLKVERIINYQILRKEKLENLSACPLCGSTNIKKISDNTYICYNCNHEISTTYCLNCDPKRKNPILWIKYIDDKFLKNEKIVKDLSNMNKYYKLNRIENIMGEKATTSFELEKENSGWKLKTICPNCGIILGENKSLKKK